jgi:hypothetical protein
LKTSTLLKLFFLAISSIICNSAISQTKKGNERPAPTGSMPIAIISFAPTSATTGDTVTIRLMLPVPIASVEFGGVPATSFKGGEFDATIKAVVGNGASGRIKVVTTITAEADSIVGFTFVPPVADVNVSLCGPAGNASLVSNLSGGNYQWQVSIDGINYSAVNDDSIYNGSVTQTLQLTNIKDLYNSYKYRCMVDTGYSKVFTVKFENAWFGGSSLGWNHPWSWSCGVVPGVNTNVVISHGSIILNHSATVNSLTVGPNASLTVAPGAVLTVLH